MKGRITEKQLPDAEACCPGITKFYRTLPKKPRTFLELLWNFEGARCDLPPTKPTRTARGTGEFTVQTDDDSDE